MNTRDVFVIHGRDERLRAGMFDFLKSLDLHAMEWGAGGGGQKTDPRQPWWWGGALWSAPQK